MNRRPRHFDNQGHRKCSNLQIPLNAPSWLCYFWSLYKNFHVSVFITYQLFLNFIRQPDRIFQSHQACTAMPTLEQRPYSRKNTNWVCTQLEFSKNMILIQQNVEANMELCSYLQQLLHIHSTTPKEPESRSISCRNTPPFHRYYSYR